MRGFDSCFPCIPHSLRSRNIDRSIDRNIDRNKNKSINSAKNTLFLSYFKDINKKYLKKNKYFSYFKSVKAGVVHKNSFLFLKFENNNKFIKPSRLYKFTVNRPLFFLLNNSVALRKISDAYYYTTALDGRLSVLQSLISLSYFLNSGVAIHGTRDFLPLVRNSAFSRLITSYYFNNNSFSLKLINLFAVASRPSFNFTKPLNLFFSDQVRPSDLFAKSAKNLFLFGQADASFSSTALRKRLTEKSVLNAGRFNRRAVNYFSFGKINYAARRPSLPSNVSFWERFFFFKKKIFLNYKNLPAYPQARSVFNRGTKFHYFAYSKFFFSGLDFSKKFLLRGLANAFYLQPFDTVNEYLVKLTRRSINLNKNDVFTVFSPQKISSSSPFFLNAGFKILTVANNFDLSGFFFIQNYAFNLKRVPKFNSYNCAAEAALLQKKFFFDEKYLAPSRVLALLRSSPSAPGLWKNNLTVFPKLPFSLNNSPTWSLFVNSNELVSLFFSKPIFFKYLAAYGKLCSAVGNSASKVFSSFKESIESRTVTFFYSKFVNSTATNVAPSFYFTYAFKKYALKAFSYYKFPIVTMPWHYNTIVKFLENISGRQVYLNFFTFLNIALGYAEMARCSLWSQRLKSFKKSFGAKLFVAESLQIVYTALTLKDPYFLSSWLLNLFYKISFWKYKLVFRYLQYVLRYFFHPIFKEMHMRGLKFQLKGKVSVAGNGRTRTVVTKVGFNSHSTFNNKVIYDLNLVRTFTGVLGFKM